jgi:exosome complex protein LRP1
MVERENYQNEMKDLASDEEDTLDVFDDVPEEEQDEDEPVIQKPKGKGKQSVYTGDGTISDDTQAGTKRRRPAIDPFAGDSAEYDTNFIHHWYSITSGYGDDVTDDGDKGHQTASSIPFSKKSKIASSGDDAHISDGAASGQSSPASTAESLAAKQAARTPKKAKRKAKRWRWSRPYRIYSTYKIGIGVVAQYIV